MQALKQKIYEADAAVEVAGSAARSMVENLASPDIEDLIARHELGNIEPGTWVPLHKLCSLFNDAQATLGGSAAQVYVGMGMKIAEQSEFPPEMLDNLTMEIMIMGWDEHYKANHRGPTLESVVAKKIKDQQFELHVPAEGYPYPYNITYGMVYGFCKMLLPEGTHFVVEYDEDYSPYNDWRNGVIIHIGWE